MSIVNREQTDGNLATLLKALSFATGIGFGGHIEHGMNSAYLGLQIADALVLTSEEREAVFYGCLLKDVACTVCAAGVAAFFPDDEQLSLSQIILVDPASFSDMIGWLSKYVPLDAQFPVRITKLLSFLVQCKPIIKEAMRSHCEVAELFARQLGFSIAVQQTLRLQLERWDGRSMAYGLKGSAVPIAARILHIAQVIELIYHFGGSTATNVIIQEKRGTRFDPEVVDAFLSLTNQEGFWETFDQQTSESIMSIRPFTQTDSLWIAQIERVCEALADFVDLKSSESWHHSRIVATLAVKIGNQLGLKQHELVKLRCSALVHDIGIVAIPTGIVTKDEKHRSSSDWEMYRLHPYHTQRILEQVVSLKDLAQTAASHHEWVNGQGYHRQLHGKQIPLHGRILAVANTYAECIRKQGKLENPAAALSEMRPLLEAQLDSSCYEALVMSLMHDNSLPNKRSVPAKAGNLTERESEVLSLLARGQNTPQIGSTLNISRKTVEHHLEHIYSKIGVTCRTSAVVFAVQQNLV